jgi:hypothetical protein
VLKRYSVAGSLFSNICPWKKDKDVREAIALNFRLAIVRAETTSEILNKILYT